MDFATYRKTVSMLMDTYVLSWIDHDDMETALRELDRKIDSYLHEGVCKVMSWYAVDKQSFAELQELFAKACSEGELKTWLQEVL